MISMSSVDSFFLYCHCISVAVANIADFNVSFIFISIIALDPLPHPTADELINTLIN